MSLDFKASSYGCRGCGWLNVGDKCFRAFTAVEMWQEHAGVFCESYDSTLAVIETEIQYNAIVASAILDEG